MNNKEINEKYLKLSPEEHVLRRPGMYIGSIVTEEKETFVIHDDKFSLEKVSYNPGFLKIFD